MEFEITRVNCTYILLGSNSSILIHNNAVFIFIFTGIIELMLVSWKY